MTPDPFCSPPERNRRNSYIDLIHVRTQVAALLMPGQQLEIVNHIVNDTQYRGINLWPNATRDYVEGNAATVLSVGQRGLVISLEDVHGVCWVLLLINGGLWWTDEVEGLRVVTCDGSAVENDK